MAGSIRGIIVEIGGDTSGLKKALGEVEKSSKSIQSELTKVNKALKLDPSNTTLLKQKQDLLKESLQANKDKLDALKKALDEAGKSNNKISPENMRALEREIETTKAQINKLTIETNSFVNAGDKIKNVADNMKKVGDATTNVGKKMTASVTAPIVALGTAGVKYNMDLEKSMANMTVLMGGNEEQASKLLGDIKEMAKTTPFETSNLVSATQTMMGFGIQADKSQEYLKQLGDISMGDAQKLESLTLAFSQISSAGKLSGQDLLQMINAGFNPLNIISQKTGESMASLKERMSQGAVSSEEVAQALKWATEEGGLFYGAMDKASQTTSGKFSTAIDSLKEALGSLTESVLPVVTKFVDKIIELANWFNNLDDNTKNTITTILLIVGAIGPILMIIGKVITAVSTVIKIGGLVVKGIGLLTTALNPVTLIIMAIIGAIGLLVAGFTYLWNHCEGFRNFWIELWENIKNFVSEAIDFIVNVFNTIVDFVKDNWQSLLLLLVNPFVGGFKLLYDNCEGFRNFIDNFIGAIKNGFHTALNWLVSLFTEKIPNLVNNIINWFKELPSKLIQIGKDAIQGLLNGFTNAGNIIWDAIKSVGNSMLDGIKNFFGIASPSKVMAKEIGRWIPAGIGVGVEANTDSALKSIDDMNRAINTEVAGATYDRTYSNTFNTKDIAMAFVGALKDYGLKVEVDGETFGNLVSEKVDYKFGEMM